MEAMEKQTKANGAKITYELVVAIEKKENIFHVKTEENTTYQAKAIVLGMGSRYRKMRVDGEEEFFAKGVSYCAVCDGALYQGKPTAVIGYGTGAVKAALYLANISSKVYLLCTKKELEAEAIYEARLPLKDNIEIHYQSKIEKISGNDFVEAVSFIKNNEQKTVKVEAAFIEYGSIPNAVLAEQLGVTVNENGYIVSNATTMETNIPGVYAIGDVCGRIKQIATAVGDGCISAYQVQSYLEK